MREAGGDSAVGADGGDVVTSVCVEVQDGLVADVVCRSRFWEGLGGLICPAGEEE